jgi:hypothetical protein
MRFRDLVKFSLELFLPQRALEVFARRATGARQTTEPQRADAQIASTTQAAESPTRDRPKSDSKQLIIELDSAHFGGPSFGEQSITMMAEVLDDVLAALPPPLAASTERELAAMILRRAADGDRNPDRLREAVLDEFLSPKPDI